MLALPYQQRGVQCSWLRGYREHFNVTSPPCCIQIFCPPATTSSASPPCLPSHPLSLCLQGSCRRSSSPTFAGCLRDRQKRSESLQLTMPVSLQQSALCRETRHKKACAKITELKQKIVNSLCSLPHSTLSFSILTDATGVILLTRHSPLLQLIM